jgi:hypothetical protein
MFRGSNPGRGKRFSFSKNVLTTSAAHPHSYSMDTELGWGGVRPVHEADHSPPSCAKIKNEWSHTPAPLMASRRAEGPFHFTIILNIDRIVNERLLNYLNSPKTMEQSPS